MAHSHFVQVTSAAMYKTKVQDLVQELLGENAEDEQAII